MFTGVSLRVEPTLQLGDGLTLPGEISPMSIRTPGETLGESMTRLERGLVTGTLLLQFEVRTCYSAHGVSWCACMCFANCYPSMCVCEFVCVLLLAEIGQEESRNVVFMRSAVREYGQESVQRCITM